MKKSILLILILFVVFISGCSDKASTDIEAKVLVIETKILEGNLIGSFLSGSSGSFRSDMIKVGVKFKIGDRLFLEDLELKHSELAYYSESDAIPLIFSVVNGCQSYYELRIHGRQVIYQAITPDFAVALIEDINQK